MKIMGGNIYLSGSRARADNVPHQVYAKAQRSLPPFSDLSEMQIKCYKKRARFKCQEFKKCNSSAEVVDSVSQTPLSISG